jgi:hypothetical protein
MPSDGGHGIYRKHLIPPGAAQAKRRKEAAIGAVVRSRDAHFSWAGRVLRGRDLSFGYPLYIRMRAALFGLPLAAGASGLRSPGFRLPTWLLHNP